MNRKKLVLMGRKRRSDNFSLRDVGNAFKDVTKVGAAPFIVAAQKIANKPVDMKFDTGIAKTVAASGAGKVAADVVRLGTAPITNAISSVKGQPINNGYVTGVGKVVGKLNDTGNQGVNIVAKSFADTISGGLASKAKNALAEKIDPKGKLGYVPETAYNYGEMKPTQSSGIKLLDKAASVVPVASAVVGTLVGAKVGADALGNAVSKDTSNMKPTNVAVGDNVLTKQQPIVTDTPKKAIDNGLPNNLPKGVQHGDIPTTSTTPVVNPVGNTAMASFGSFDLKNPWVIGGMILLVILMLSTANSSQANA